MAEKSTNCVQYLKVHVLMLRLVLLKTGFKTYSISVNPDQPSKVKCSVRTHLQVCKHSYPSQMGTPDRVLFTYIVRSVLTLSDQS